MALDSLVEEVSRMQLITYRIPIRSSDLPHLLEDAHLAEATDAAELVRRVRSDPVDGVVIGANAVTREEIAGLRDLERYRSVPLLLFGRLSPILTGAAVDLNRWTNPQLVIAPFDTDPEDLRDFLWSHPPARLRRALWNELLIVLAGAPPRLRATLSLMWEDHPLSLCLKTLSIRSGYSSRWVYDCLTDAGIREPHAIFQAVRAANAWGYAQDQGFSLTEIARKSGYRTTRSLFQVLTRLTGMQTRNGLAAVGENDMLSTLLKRLFGRK